MTRKEQRELAEKIAKEEKIIQDYSKNKEARNDAQKRIIKLIDSSALTLEDMWVIDEMVQDILS